MTTVFADTSYYLALVNSRDEHHATACAYTDGFDGASVTTEPGTVTDFLC